MCLCSHCSTEPFHRVFKDFFKNRKYYAEKTVLTACFYLVELQKNFKRVSQRELLDLQNLIIKLTLHTLYCCLIPNLNRGHTQGMCRTAGNRKWALALISCSEWDVSSGKPHSVVNLDASRWLSNRILLKLFINQSKHVDKRQSYRHVKGGWIIKGCLSYACKEFIAYLRICKSAHGCICYCIGYMLYDIILISH